MARAGRPLARCRAGEMSAIAVASGEHYGAHWKAEIGVNEARLAEWHVA